MMRFFVLAFVWGCAFLPCPTLRSAVTEQKSDVKEFSLNSAKKTSEVSLEKALTQSKPVSSPETEKKDAAESKAEGSIYFNFDNASLLSVLNYLIDRKNLDVLPHKDLQNIKVSLVSREPMTIDEAWETALLLMEANNFTIAKINDVHRVIPLTASQQVALPCYSSARGTEPEDLPDTNTQCRYIYFCKNLKVSVAQSILAPMVSERGLQVNNTLQACVLTDNCNTIKAAMRVIKELDLGGIRQTIKILQLQHANADQLAKLFNEQIIGQQSQDNKIRIIAEDKRRDLSFFSKETKILTDPARNRLIFMGMEDAISKVIEFINKYLDVPLDKAGSRIHVKELKYYNAADMKDLLSAIIASPANQSQASMVDGSYRFFQDVVVSTDASRSDGQSSTRGSGGNRLIVSCSDEDWKRLCQFIDEIDKAQPQLALEIMIVDLRVADNKALGTQLRAPNGLAGNNIHGSSFMLTPTSNTSVNAFDTTATNLLSRVQVDANSSIISFGDASSNQVWGAIRAMYSIDHTNIITQPYLIVNNNTKVVEKMTDKRPTYSVESNNSSNPMQTLQTAPATINTTITPHANASGIVTLDIDITVDEYKSSVYQNLDTTNRQITTRASMAAGEVLVLGGLTSTRHTVSHFAIPGLSAIPVVGNLFKDTTLTNVKNNLYIFIRPTFVKPHTDLGVDEYTQLKLDYAKYQVMSYNSMATSKDPIQRYFFGSRSYSPKERLQNAQAHRMPIIDDYAERRRMPNEVEITKDPLFKPQIEESSIMEYEPEENFASFPHMDPTNYVAPGVIEDLMGEDFFKEVENTLQESRRPEIAKRKSALQKAS